MSTVRRWDRLTRTEIAGLAPEALLVLPVGSTEQHGPHLATGTDAALAGEIARRAAEAAARPETILLAPTLAYGASDHHLPFGATLSLRLETFALVLRDLLASAASAGCRRAFLLNGHGGNTASCAAAVAEAARADGILCASAIYSQLLEPGTIDAPVPGHAGQFETSLMLAVAADGVRPEAARSSPGGAARTRHRGLTVAEPGRWQELEGFTDRPETASPELGAQLLDACVRATAAAFEEVAGLDV
ncbi:MAG TPA: creatininase family protein [Gaiellaceae bacterium]|nr:creatininase family protein [Gaiellaceae bacterium]